MGVVTSIRQNKEFLYSIYQSKQPTTLYYATDNQLKSLAWAINKVVHKKIPLEKNFSKNIDKFLKNKKSYFYKHFSNPKNLSRKTILYILLDKKRFRNLKAILAPYYSKYVPRRKKVGVGPPSKNKKGAAVRRAVPAQKNKQ